MSTPRSARTAHGESARRFRLRRGLDLPIPGAPDASRIEPGPPISRVALLGSDAPGVHAELRVAQGERVRLGQTLFVDRRRPALRFTAPGSGVIRAVERGVHRRLESVEIDLDGEDAPAETLEPRDVGAVMELPADRVREILLASGLWTALRTRPFSRIPDPQATPRSIFVTAIESEPLAPPAERVIAERGGDFAVGVAALARLGTGAVFVCARPDAGLPLPDAGNVVLAEFEGPHPAGLPGTHIHHLDPVGPGRCVWHLGYPGVLAIGALLRRGTPCAERVVAVAGPGVARPRLVRTREGARVDELVRGELRDGASRVVSGSALSGREAVGFAGHLGRLHTQVCALPEPAERGPWLVPGRRGRWRRPFGPVCGGAHRVASTSLGGRPGCFLALERSERVVPLDLPVGPLARALAVGDAEAAQRLGCLELAEEDLALVSFLCPGKLDYGALLREVLDPLEEIFA